MGKNTDDSKNPSEGESSNRVQSPTTHQITIDSGLKEYLDDYLHKCGAEMWYTGQLKLDLTDYNGAIKSIVNDLQFERDLSNKRLPVNIPFTGKIFRFKENE